MCCDRCCQFVRLRHLVFWIVARVPQPCDIEVVIPCPNFLALKETESALLSFVPPLRLAQWIFPERLLKRCEIGDREWPRLAKGIHVCPHVVNPDTLRIGLVVLTAREEHDIRLHALRVE